MFGKEEALAEKYPVFFTLGLLISSILRGKISDPHRKKRSAREKATVPSFIYM